MTNDTDAMNASSTPAPTLDADDPRLLLARAVGTAGAVIAGARTDQMGLPTPCAAFDVQGLIGHLVSVLDRIVVIGSFGNVLEVPDRRALEADETWPDLWASAAHAVQEVWSDDSLLDATVQLPWRTVTGRPALAIYTNEVTVHTWDLARATQQQPSWDPEVVELSLASIHTELPEADRAPQWAEVAAHMPPGVPFDPPFADAVPVDPAAPAIEHLVAWNGRRP